MTNKVFTYLTIATNGTTHEFHHRLRPDQTRRAALRATLGGELERIRVVYPTLYVGCDTEGWVKGLDANHIGSRLVHRIGQPAPLRYHRAGNPDVLWVGTLIMAGYDDGTFISLTSAQIWAVLAELDHCR